MHEVVVPRIDTATAWRDAARGLLAAGIPPENVLWHWGEATPTLFDTDRPCVAQADVRVPKGFLSLSQSVVWHSDPDRFDRLYAFLWRLSRGAAQLSDRGDAALSALRRMEKAVHRCQHKMKAFVRFREVPGRSGRRAFAAWFEPTHHTLEPTAPFFARRFADMDWMIATPDVTARFQDGQLTFGDGQPKPNLPDDATEELWGTYFCNIFNPARLKIQAMTSEMPKKYWKNMPEARHIPELIATAEARVAEMRDRAPTLPPERVEAIRRQMALAAQPASWNMLDAGLSACSRCPLHCTATQVVPGGGPRDAALMIVGEQPGETEDLTGRPFVGPAGQLLRRAAKLSGLDMDRAYVTNAVKHFKFEQRGKRRIHQNPNRHEVEHCRFWLETEIALVKPQLILALGATALQALTGDRRNILRRRGRVEQSAHGPVFVTVHPSHILRLPEQERAWAEAALADDLRGALGHLGRVSSEPAGPSLGR